MHSVTMGLLPSESSFNGGSPADDDMVKMKELVRGDTTAFGSPSANFHTGSKAQ